MKIGVIAPQQDLGTDPTAIGAWAVAVEHHRFAFIDIFDHVLGADVGDRPDWPGPYTDAHPFHEPFTLLAHLSALIDIELATGVLVLPQRQTVLVAKQAAELDLLTCGRFRLGVGIGWNPVEYEAMGMSFADRSLRYESQIELLRRLWTEPVVDHADPHHRVDRAGLAPRPPRPIPLWLGGGTGPPVLERIGRLGDGWIVHDPHPDDQLVAALAHLRRAAEDAGRDPGAIGVQGRVDVHGSLDRDRCHRAIEAWHRAGATHLALHVAARGDLAPHLDLLPELATICGDHLDLEGPA